MLRDVQTVLASLQISRTKLFDCLKVRYWAVKNKSNRNMHTEHQKYRKKQNKCILNRAKNEEYNRGEADRWSKGLQTPWLLLLVVKLKLLRMCIVGLRLLK